MDEFMTNNKTEIGRASFRAGYNFEDKVAEIYRLQNYKLEHGRLFGGRQVDIFLVGNFGDLTIYRAIECKAGPISTNDLDMFLIKLNLVRREYPSIIGTLVTGASFTDAVTTHASSIGVHLITQLSQLVKMGNIL
jgi:hypothetical protein